MDPQYLQHLPQRIQGLVDEIESHAARQIGVGPNPDAPPPDSIATDILAVSVETASATILFRDPAEFRPEPVLHELLHIRRFWVEAVPQMTVHAYAPGYRAMLDNALEHLVVVPRELDYGEDPYPHWNGIYAKLLPKFAALTKADAIRREALTVYATLNRMVTDGALREQWTAAVRATGHLPAALTFARELEAAVGNKGQMIKTTLTHLDISDFHVSLRVMDAKAGTARPLGVWDL